MGPPSQRHLVALGRQRLEVQRLEEQQKYLQKQTALVRAELYRAGISAKDDAGATARLARETSRYNQELSKQEARPEATGGSSAQDECGACQLCPFTGGA
ncbi:hypothetical protein ABE91_013420 [Escherichia coli]|uniref:Uncharacterized protein n=1 Tax=Escherichia coli TaxID=562 RepID=A0AAP8AUH8_ECOLX|nr:hypothetical protein ABE91_013420 [Escherichia coli]